MMKATGRYPTIVFLILMVSFLAQSVDGGKRRRRRRAKEKAKIEAMQKPVKKPVIIKDTIKKVPESVVKKVAKETVPLVVPVPQWVGKKFVLLEKTKVFRKFGYELYPTPELSKSTTPVDPAIVLKNHRIKYKPFCKTVVTVTSVEKDGQGEYLVTFLAEKQQLTLYGKTKEGVIEGIAMERDLQTAKKRWEGKTIYCRRRFVDVYDPAISNFTSAKVPITEPLKVIDIKWGIIPLPPKLLWLHVERVDGSKGIIPTNVSWTNVIKRKKQVKVPWEHELFEKNPKELYAWDTYVWETINKHNIYIGMTIEQVSFSWGEPKNKSVKKNEIGKEVAICYYDGRVLTFENGVLVKSQ